MRDRHQTDRGVYRTLTLEWSNYKVKVNEFCFKITILRCYHTSTKLAVISVKS